MNYQRIHDEIITDSRISSPIGHKHNNKTMEYKELHHIFPKCLAIDRNNKLLDIPSNLIYLESRRHFIIHRLLTKIYPENNKLLYAFQMMFSGSQKRRSDKGWIRSASKNYEYFKKQRLDMLRNRVVSDETKYKLSSKGKNNTNNLGKRHSEETKLKMSEAHKNMTVETRKKMSEASKGRIYSVETRLKISNYNKTRIFSDKTRQKMSDSHKDISQNTRQKMSNAAKNRSEEHKLKIINYAKNRTAEHRQKLSNAAKGKIPSEATRLKMSISKRLRDAKNKQNNDILMTESISKNDNQKN